ncbi:MAG TPA: hypothetical protein PLU35_10545 [Phycisphaerales bacterium]|nr:hypothetical protein [Phycisphaerales bacterium]
MGQIDLLIHAVRSLDAVGIPYMLTGSYALSVAGAIRSTHDIDIVVELGGASLPALLDAFPASRFHFSRNAAEDAVRRRTMFNILDEEEGDKVDFWMLTDDAFDRIRFERRRTVEFRGTRLSVSTPEDTILMKLRWSADSGGSGRQMRDVQTMYAMCAGTLDEPYLSQWADRLGVRDELDRIRRENPPTAPDHSR